MKNPFEVSPEQLDFMSEQQKEAHFRMKRTIETNSLGVFTGEVGSGKSTLLRTLCANLPSTEYQWVYLSSAGLTPKELYSGILRHLGETPAFSLPKIKQQWQEALDARLSGNYRQLVACIDEAHDLQHPTLLELRFLMSHGIRPASPFPVILAGQSQLRQTLRKNLFEPIAQRIHMQYHLIGMSVKECSDYIEHRLKSANLERPVFTEDAKKLVFSISQGIPRVINLLCGHALYAANQRNENAVDERLIKVVTTDLDRQRGDR